MCVKKRTEKKFSHSKFLPHKLSSFFLIMLEIAKKIYVLEKSLARIWKDIKIDVG